MLVTLQKALSSLDVSLEGELARYRRLRPQQPDSRRHLNSQQLHPLELLKQGKEPSVAPADAEPVTKQVLPSPEPVDPGETSATSSLVHQPAAPDSEVEKPELPAPQEYLQSSEGLLRSLKIEPKKEEEATDSLLTPLGIGSVLVLLISSALLSSALIDSEGFKRLALDRLKIGNLSPQNTDGTEVEVAPINSPEPEISQSPNLANQEFVDLNLDTLSTLPLEDQQSGSAQPPSPPGTTQPAPTASQTLTSTGTGSNLTAALLPPALRPQPVEPIESSSETTSAAIKAAPAPTSKDLYFVMVDYTGANSLANAKVIVDEAYLVKLPQGIHIQMGSFLKESLAQTFVKDLQEKGFVASIYRPR
jgi:hypothetical protein